MDSEIADKGCPTYSDTDQGSSLAQSGSTPYSTAQEELNTSVAKCPTYDDGPSSLAEMNDSDSDDEKNYFAAIDDIDNLGQRDEDDADFESDDEGGFGDGDDMKDPLSDGDDLSQLEHMLTTMGGVKQYGEALA